MRTVSLVMAAITLIVGGCTKGPTQPERITLVGSLPLADVRIITGDEEIVFEVEIAETPEARARGLMFVEQVPAGYGMAFLYDEPTESGFWMKNTLVPLEIAYWNPEMEIVSILRMEPCTEDPCRGYNPGSPYIGALETAWGAMSGTGVRLGSKIELIRSD